MDYRVVKVNGRGLNDELCLLHKFVHTDVAVNALVEAKDGSIRLVSLGNIEFVDDMYGRLVAKKD